jgi:hypothetical protein
MLNASTANIKLVDIQRGKGLNFIKIVDENNNLGNCLMFLETSIIHIPQEKLDSVTYNGKYANTFDEVQDQLTYMVGPIYTFLILNTVVTNKDKNGKTLYWWTGIIQSSEEYFIIRRTISADYAVNDYFVSRWNRSPAIENSQIFYKGTTDPMLAEKLKLELRGIFDFKFEEKKPTRQPVYTQYKYKVGLPKYFGQDIHSENLVILEETSMGHTEITEDQMLRSTWRIDRYWTRIKELFDLANGEKLLSSEFKTFDEIKKDKADTYGWYPEMYFLYRQNYFLGDYPYWYGGEDQMIDYDNYRYNYPNEDNDYLYNNEEYSDEKDFEESEFIENEFIDDEKIKWNNNNIDNIKAFDPTNKMYNN